MKSKLVPILLAAVVVAAGAFFVLRKDNDDKSVNSGKSETNTQTTQQTSQNNNGPKLAAQSVGQQADCSTYSFSELQKVWGVPFVDTDINKVSELSTNGGKLYSCAYNETDSGKGVTFSIEYREHPSVDSAKQSISDTRSTEKYGDKVYYIKEEVSGVGDEAFYWAQNRTDGAKLVNQQMYVRKGNVVFLLSGVNIDGIGTNYKDNLKASYLLHFN